MLIEFLCNICQIFEKIFKRNENYIDMKNDLIEFGKFLNKIDYKTLLYAGLEKKEFNQLIIEYLQLNF